MVCYTPGSKGTHTHKHTRMGEIPNIGALHLSWTNPCVSRKTVHVYLSDLCLLCDGINTCVKAGVSLSQLVLSVDPKKKKSHRDV